MSEEEYNRKSSSSSFPSESDNYVKINVKEGRDAFVFVHAFNQTELGWRRVVFLPFNVYWRFLIAVSCFMHIGLFLYDQVYDKATEMTRSNEFVYVTLLLMDCFYAVDVLLTMLHAVWESVRKSMPYHRKNIALIGVDILTLIPLWLFFKGNVLQKDGNIIWYKLWCFNGCIRVYRVFDFLLSLQADTAINPLVIVFMRLNVFSVFMSCVLGTIWYILGNLPSEQKTWLTEYQKDENALDVDNPTIAFFLTLQTMYVTFNNDVTTIIIPVTTTEVAFIAFVNYFGFLFRQCYMLTAVVDTFLKYRAHMYTILDHAKINKKIVPHEAKQKLIDEYYKTYWRNWLGLHKCPLLNMFPLCFQKDVMTDGCWESLTHSHVLRHFPIGVKRGISLSMNSKLLQAGDFVYRKGELRSTYFYIASGIVQIMSHYDGVSPIMTISAGSCLGSSSLVMPSVSPTDVICGTDCEVRCITYSQFYLVLSMYDKSNRICIWLKHEFLSHAKLMKTLCLAYKQKNPLTTLYGVSQDDKIKWIKQRWRVIRNLPATAQLASEKSLKKMIRSQIPADATHTSKYLDVLVLNNKGKWKADMCCIKSTCSFVIDPDCNFIFVWHWFIFCAVTIDCTITPFCAAYLNYTPRIIAKWNNLMFITYFLDLYLQSITAIKSVDQIITQPNVIFRHHLKRFTFIVDIFASVPLHIMVTPFYNKNQDVAIDILLSMNRLLKLIRVYQFFHAESKSILSNSHFIRPFKIIYTYTFTLHISACLAFMMVCEYKDNTLTCAPYSWFDIFPKQGAEKVVQVVVSTFCSYVYVSTLTTMVGLNHVISILPGDIVFNTFIICIAKNLFVATFAELMTMWVMSKRRHVMFQKLLTTVNHVLLMKDVHPGLINMMKVYLQLQWTDNLAVRQEIDWLSHTDIFTPIATQELRTLVTKCIKNVEFFNTLDETLVKKIQVGFKMFVVPQGYIFCRSGERSSCYNILLRGRCHTTSMLREDVIEHPTGTLLGPGDHFSLMEILQNIPCMQTTISLTTCYVATIDASLLKSHLYRDVYLKFHITRSIPDNFIVDVIVSKKKYSKTIMKTASFIPRRSNKRRDNLLIRRFVMHIIMILWEPPFIIHPKGWFMIIWETIKVCQVIACLIYIPIMMLMICNGKFYKFYVALLLDAISTLDIYVRLQLGHFNREGVLVNSKYRYFSHAFTVDFLSTLPFYLLLYYDLPFRVTYFVTISTKFLSVYRILGYTRELHNEFNLAEFITTGISFCCIMISLLFLLSTVTFSVFCENRCHEGSYEVMCFEKSWLSEIANNKDYNSQNLLLYSVSLTTSIAMGIDPGSFYLTSFKEVVFLFFVGIVSCVGKLYYFPKVSAHMIEHNLFFTKHRENTKAFDLFVSQEGANKDIAYRIREHFFFNYRRLLGVDINKLFSSLHPSFNSDISFAMYYKATLCLHRIFGPSRSFMKMLTQHFQEVHFMKGTTILCRNYVNKYMYFIREGHVAVVNRITDRKIRTLNPGELFGSFKVTRKHCHVYEFISEQHCYLVKIATKKFISVLRRYNKYSVSHFEKFTKNTEFMTLTTVTLKKSVSLLGNESMNSSEFIRDTSMTNLKFLHRDSRITRFIMFGLSMLVPFFTVFPVLLTMTVVRQGMSYLLLLIFIYLLDIIWLCRLYLGFNTTYLNARTGEYVTEPKTIAWNYIKKPWEFALDLMAVIPFEVVGYAVTSNLMPELRANRLLRLLTLCFYCLQHSREQYVKQWLRWNTFLSLIILTPFIITISWICVASDAHCDKTKTWADKVANSFDTLANGFSEVITVITFSCSFILNKPCNNFDCILLTALTFAAYVYFPSVVASFMQKVELSDFQNKEYSYRIYCMKLYLQLRNLSKSLLQELWDYALLLWSTNRGQQIPHYLERAPYNLRCQILYDLYGGHIKYNILFELCNADFLHQVAGRLRRTVYFPGNVIVRKWDVDERMYFINSGEVAAIKYNDLHKEEILEVYITGQCFGLAQGLYPRLPHLNTYKAKSKVHMLTLQRSNIKDLLVAFPVDSHIIYRIANQFNMDIFDTEEAAVRISLNTQYPQALQRYSSFKF